MSDIEAENPEAVQDDDQEQEVGLLTVGDLIEQLQQYDPDMPARAVIRAFDSDEGRDTDDPYDIMFTEILVDEEPDSDTVGQNYVGLISDLRLPEDDDNDFVPATGG